SVVHWKYDGVDIYFLSFLECLLLLWFICCLYNFLMQLIFEKVSQTAASDVVQQVSYAVEKEGGGFALSMHAKDFSPEEMSIKQVGRTLHVCGKTEKREEDGEGSYSHRVQEFRREFLLPEGVNPEVLSCSLAEGKLFIQTPKTQQSEKPDRLTLPLRHSANNTLSGTRNPGPKSLAFVLPG
uniref:SHSP domain-containing protein n=1 Tax=Pygocentrus nattereri TaxID=42514 RepID=A0A3B4EL65_PYGNA